MVGSLHHYYVGHCPLSEVYLIYTMFGSWLYLCRQCLDKCDTHMGIEVVLAE
jgi:hypothetical protein